MCVMCLDCKDVCVWNDPWTGRICVWNGPWTGRIYVCGMSLGLEGYVCVCVEWPLTGRICGCGMALGLEGYVCVEWLLDWKDICVWNSPWT